MSIVTEDFTRLESMKNEIERFMVLRLNGTQAAKKARRRESYTRLKPMSIIPNCIIRHFEWLITQFR